MARRARSWSARWRTGWRRTASPPASASWKSFRVADDGHDALLLRQHLIAQGPPLPRDVVRAAAARLVNAFAQGLSGARPELAERIVEALNDDDLPSSLGSVGQADLAQTADLAVGLLGDEAPAPGEGIALLNQNAFSAGHAALPVHDARALLDSLDVAGALDLEALGANRESLLHPALASARPSPGLQVTLDRLRALVAGSRSRRARSGSAELPDAAAAPRRRPRRSTTSPSRSSAS